MGSSPCCASICRSENYRQTIIEGRTQCDIETKRDLSSDNIINTEPHHFDPSSTKIKQNNPSNSSTSNIMQSFDEMFESDDDMNVCNS